MKKLCLLFKFLVIAVFASKGQLPIPLTPSQIDIPMNSTDDNPADSGKYVITSGIVEGPSFYPDSTGMAFFITDHSRGVEIYSKHVYSSYPALVDGDSIVVLRGGGLRCVYRSGAEGEERRDREAHGGSAGHGA